MSEIPGGHNGGGEDPQRSSRGTWLLLTMVAEIAQAVYWLAVATAFLAIGLLVAMAISPYDSPTWAQWVSFWPFPASIILVHASPWIRRWALRRLTSTRQNLKGEDAQVSSEDGSRK